MRIPPSPGYLAERLPLRAFVKKSAGKLFPANWSFLLGEITLYAFVGLLLSGIYLALFFSPSTTAVVYHGADRSLEGRLLPEAFVSVMHLSLEVPFGLVVRRFDHFAAHLFIATMIVHAARVFFTGAFRWREITWWLGLTMLAVALLNGFTGYAIPFDMRGGAAIRQLLTTLETIPWLGRWLATLTFGAEFPGPFIVRRLYIEHVFLGPLLLLALLAAHLYLVVKLTHTQYPGPGRSDAMEARRRPGLGPGRALGRAALFRLRMGFPRCSRLSCRPNRCGSTGRTNR